MFCPEDASAAYKWPAAAQLTTGGEQLQLLKAAICKELITYMLHTPNVIC